MQQAIDDHIDHKSGSTFALRITFHGLLARPEPASDGESTVLSPPLHGFQ